jgi:hypothetical protein
MIRTKKNAMSASVCLEQDLKWHKSKLICSEKSGSLTQEESKTFNLLQKKNAELPEKEKILLLLNFIV